MRRVLASLLLVAVAACRPGLDVGTVGSAAVNNVTLLETGIFQVPGAAGQQNWCIAGLYGSTILRLPPSQRLTRIAQIPAGTTNVAGRSVTGPGVLYSSRSGGSVFDVLAGALNENRTVQTALDECN
ncbi:hypothetical protein [Halovulum sp. GXIMD14793]